MMNVSIRVLIFTVLGAVLAGMSSCLLETSNETTKHESASAEEMGVHPAVSEVVRIKATAYSYLMNRHLSSSKELVAYRGYCIDETGEEKKRIVRLVAHGAMPIVDFPTSAASYDGKPARSGLKFFKVRLIELNVNKASVEASWYSGTRAGGKDRMILEKEEGNGRWRVEHIESIMVW